MFCKRAQKKKFTCDWWSPPSSTSFLWHKNSFCSITTVELQKQLVTITTKKFFLKGILSQWQHLKKSGWLFQVWIFSSRWYHNDRTFFQLHYTGIAIFIKTGPVFVGFCCRKIYIIKGWKIILKTFLTVRLSSVFALLNFWSDARDSVPLSIDSVHNIPGWGSWRRIADSRRLINSLFICSFIRCI